MSSNQLPDNSGTQPSYRRPTDPHGADDRLLTIDEVAELVRIQRRPCATSVTIAVDRAVSAWDAVSSSGSVTSWPGSTSTTAATDRVRLDGSVVSDNTGGTSIRFMQSARIHRIGRASARFVMATVTPVAITTSSGAAAWLWVAQMNEAEKSRSSA